MPLGRVYTVDSTPITYTGTTATPLLLGQAPATGNVNIQAFRIGIISGSGVSYPSNGSVLCQLARVANTPAGGSAVTPNPHLDGGLAAQSTWTIGSWSTAPTAGAVLWGQPIAFTAGSGWGEWVTPGSEWNVGASHYIAVFVTASSGGTATEFNTEVVFGE